jgi:hypothetical protein
MARQWLFGNKRALFGMPNSTGFIAPVRILLHSGTVVANVTPQRGESRENQSPDSQPTS